MKKLLGFITSFSLISGATITAVSCNSVQRFKDVTITDELASKIIYGLTNSDDFNLANRDIFYKDIDFKNKVIDMINERISAANYKSSIVSLNQSLGLSDDSKDSGLERNKEVLSNLASFNLFNEYTTKRLESSVNIDETDKIYRDKIHPLNPIKLKVNSKEQAGNYAIYYKTENNKWLRWQMTGEFDLINSSTISTYQIPSIELLTNLGNNFRIGILDDEKSKTQDYITNTNSVDDNGKGNNGQGDNKIDWYQNDEKKPFETNGEGIIKYRFAYYFKTRVESKLFSNLLGSSYLDSKLSEDVFDNTTASSRKLILNGASQLISNIQSNFNQQTNTVSNVKMVWALSTEAKNIGKIDKLINDYFVSGQKLKSNKLPLKFIYELITTKGIEVESNVEPKDIKLGLDIKNESKQGSDAFLAMSGFNGFVQNDKETIKSLNGDLKISDDAKKAVSKINTPMILTNNGNGYDSDVKGNKDVVFVLPIYLNDVFSTSDIQIQKQANNDYTLNILENTWTDMSQKFDITNKNNNEKELTIKSINTNGNDKVQIANKDKKWYVKLKNGQSEGNIEITYSNEAMNKTITLKKVEKSNYKTLDVTKKLADTNNNKDLFSNVDKDFTKSFITYDYNIKNYRNLLDKQNSIYDWFNSEKSSADILSLSAENKQTLLDQLKSIISNNDDVKNAAKTELYSQYLKSDSVKYQDLFDEISKFIRDDEVTFD
ncbi:Hypothetical protein, predicted lipoprotein [Mycoplasma yeatsii 13926]|uniref:Lipoprotein n=1 Tax=Mycoplasma yeatsii 13926 TaxID=1188240 RepID=S6G3I8_9MOLU|nr:lipoprotein [Mycoplasma yeatsii]EOA06962.1 Hypothetical protein, predicted lipoprotein [Mycoplasma yeatsii 13926]